MDKFRHRLDRENSGEGLGCGDLMFALFPQTKRLCPMNLWRVFAVVRARQGSVGCTGSDDKTSQTGGLYDPALVARILY